MRTQADSSDPDTTVFGELGRSLDPVPGTSDGLPEVVVDTGELIRHRPRSRYARRSYWTRCRRVAIDFPQGVSPETSWVEDCPQCFPADRKEGPSGGLV